MKLQSQKNLNAQTALELLSKMNKDKPEKFHEVLKILNNYDQHQNDQKCFQQLNLILVEESDIVENMNQYLGEGNGMLIQGLVPNLETRILRLVDRIKEKKVYLFSQLIKYSDILVRGSSYFKKSYIYFLREKLEEYCWDDPELLKQIPVAFAETPEQMIDHMNLDYLKDQYQSIEGFQIYFDEKYKKVGPFEIQNNCYELENQNKMEQEEYIPHVIVNSRLRSIPPKSYVKNQYFEQEKPKFKRQYSRPKAKTHSKQPQKERYHEQQSQMPVKRRKTSNTQQKLYKKSKTQVQEFVDMVRDPTTELNSNKFHRYSPSYIMRPSYISQLVNLPEVPPELQPKFNDTQLTRNFINRVLISISVFDPEGFKHKRKTLSQQKLISSEDRLSQIDNTILKFKQFGKMLQKIKGKSQNAMITESTITRTIKNIFSVWILKYSICQRPKPQQLYFQLFKQENLRKTEFRNEQQTKSRLIQIYNEGNQKEISIITELFNFYITTLTQYKNGEYKPTLQIANAYSHTIYQSKQNAIEIYDGFHLKQKDLFGHLQDKESIKHEGQSGGYLMSFWNSFRTIGDFKNQYNHILNCPQVFYQNQHQIPNILLSFKDKSTVEFIYSIIIYKLESSPKKLQLNYQQYCFIQAIFKQVFGTSSFRRPMLNSNKQQLQGEMLFNQMRQNPQILDRYFEMEDCLLNYMEAFDSSDLNNLQNTGYSSILYATKDFYIFIRHLHFLYQRILILKTTLLQKQYNPKLIWFFLYFSITNKQPYKNDKWFYNAVNQIFAKEAFLWVNLHSSLDRVVNALRKVVLCDKMKINIWKTIPQNDEPQNQKQNIQEMMQNEALTIPKRRPSKREDKCTLRCQIDQNLGYLSVSMSKNNQDNL